MAIGPIAHYHRNSKYYSAIPPRPNPVVDQHLPHITIQMPVYKEGLDAVLAPSVESLKKAMKTYARQGGTSTIFVNDDGLQSLPQDERDARMAFYATHNIGFVARPPHSDDADGFKRAGRFKKASNMNYALALSLKLEKHLETLLEQEKQNGRTTLRSSAGIQSLAAAEARGTPEPEDDMDIEDKALLMALEETHVAAGNHPGFKPIGANGRSIRIGEFILLVDSDTIVPEDCLRDAAREMTECPEVAILQHDSGELTIHPSVPRSFLDPFSSSSSSSSSSRCYASRPPLLRKRNGILY
jgi:cellulose synthase/poly-beta-1,6-N-acetylglucosamine synthase-like glycosyltransferase